MTKANWEIEESCPVVHDAEDLPVALEILHNGKKSQIPCSLVNSSTSSTCPMSTKQFLVKETVHYPCYAYVSASSKKYGMVARLCDATGLKYFACGEKTWRSLSHTSTDAM